jgi:type I restriction enzyme M protein
MAEAYYGVPKDIREKTGQFLDQRLTKILKTFEQKYPPKVTE